MTAGAPRARPSPALGASLVVVVTAAIVLAPPAVTASSPPASERCGDCHARAAAAWEGSGHARAWSSPLFQAGLAVERRRFCVDCHAPQGAGQPIGCASCHAAPGGGEAAAGALHAPLVLRPRAALRDPAFCKDCHEFATPAWDGGVMRMTALPMQSTFAEWDRYRRAGGAGTCQSCHMPEGRHDMHGAHDIDLLRGSLALDVASNDVRGEHGGRAVTFALRSVGVGHRFPTGDLFRHLTVEVREPSAADWRVILRAGRRFETRLDAGTLTADKIELANTTLEPGETRLVTYRRSGRAPLAWRVQYHYGSARDEARAAVSYDQLVTTLLAGQVPADR